MSKGVYPRRRPTVEAIQDWVDAAQAWGPLRTRDELLAAGVTSAQAAGLAFWLVDQGHGRENVQSPTRMRYSRLLVALGAPQRGPARVSPTPPYVSPQRAA